MAPAYANMFMGRIEKQLLVSVTMRPFSWLRFIDDIDMQWLHGRDNLDTFLQEANSFHSTIRYCHIMCIQLFLLSGKLEMIFIDVIGISTLYLYILEEK